MREITAVGLAGAMLLASIAPEFLNAAVPNSKRIATHPRASHSKRTSPRSSASVPSKGKKRKGKRRSRRQDASWRRRGQKAPTPDRINEIQQALAREGAYTGATNGKWDASTIEAMRRYQTANGLNPTGKLDALTLQKLGLGSDIAGVAPPEPLSADAPIGSRRHP